MNEMSIEQLEARLSEITAIGENPEQRSNDELSALVEERKNIIAELETRKARAAEEAEKRAAIAASKTVKVINEYGKDDKTMTINELRSSAEYNRAYIRAMRGDETEIRALLSANAASGGQIPVPTQLENEIKTAWEKYSLISLVKHSYFPGNPKIGFELTATGAVVHAEGAPAPDEEVITIGSVELKAESIKKWITVSDEALEGTTVDTAGYLYSEIAQRIVEKAEEILIAKIVGAPTTSTATAVSVAEFATQSPAIDTVVKAVAMLSAQARNLHIALNRQSYAALVSTSLNNKWGADPFDGLKDRVVFTDKLPAYSAASASDTWMIIGDFGYGAQANFPSGNDMTIKYDDLSLAEKDLVKLVGRQYVGIGVVAPNAFVRVTK